MTGRSRHAQASEPDSSENPKQTDHLAITVTASTVYEPAPYGDEYEPDPPDPGEEWQDIRRRFETVWGADATAVGRHRMVLSNRSIYTGWHAVSYEEEDITMVVL